jgi:hypothetical protein
MKENKPSSIVNQILTVSFLTLGITSVASSQFLYPVTCEKEAQVMEILLPKIKLSNGETVTNYQPNVKAGDTYCLSYGRKFKSF